MDVTLDLQKLIDASAGLAASADDLSGPIRDIKALAAKIPEVWESASTPAFIDRLQMLARRIEEVEEDLRQGAARCRGIVKQVEKTEAQMRSPGFNK